MSKVMEETKTITVGTIFSRSWGYEQTNVDFYQVVEIKGQFAILRRIHTRIKEDEGRYNMAGRIVGLKDEFITEGHFVETLRKKLQFIDGSFYIAIEGDRAYVWDGESKYCSWGY